MANTEYTCCFCGVNQPEADEEKWGIPHMCYGCSVCAEDYDWCFIDEDLTDLRSIAHPLFERLERNEISHKDYCFEIASYQQNLFSLHPELKETSLFTETKEGITWRRIQTREQMEESKRYNELMAAEEN